MAGGWLFSNCIYRGKCAKGPVFRAVLSFWRVGKSGIELQDILPQGVRLRLVDTDRGAVGCDGGPGSLVLGRRDGGGADRYCPKGQDRHQDRGSHVSGVFFSDLRRLCIQTEDCVERAKTDKAGQ